MRRQSVDNYSDRIVKLQEELNKEKTARLAKEKAMDNMKVTIEGLSTSVSQTILYQTKIYIS